jgi:hypothetical protein
MAALPWIIPPSDGGSFQWPGGSARKMPPISTPAPQTPISHLPALACRPPTPRSPYARPREPMPSARRPTVNSQPKEPCT